MVQASVPTGQIKVVDKLVSLYQEAFDHEGFAEIRIEIRILRRGQKEVILHCGKQYRFTVDSAPLQRSLFRRIHDFLMQEVGTVGGRATPT
ncbi:hypothetical protein [Pseudothauera rhizosphaerae]|uniref:hypothetical protein n=1 Tax=Pseudothauera rhizosphaerae TaxID=2565932 RepID=UPI001B3B29FC|nr:hypothetical protein [Pseudothauera rhizosphaerae]